MITIIIIPWCSWYLLEFGRGDDALRLKLRQLLEVVDKIIPTTTDRRTTGQDSVIHIVILTVVGRSRHAVAYARRDSINFESRLTISESASTHEAALSVAYCCSAGAFHLRFSLGSGALGAAAQLGAVAWAAQSVCW